jgi:FAD:protein FMN transferase
MVDHGRDIGRNLDRLDFLGVRLCEFGAGEGSGAGHGCVGRLAGESATDARRTLVRVCERDGDFQSNLDLHSHSPRNVAECAETDGHSRILRRIQPTGGKRSYRIFEITVMSRRLFRAMGSRMLAIVDSDDLAEDDLSQVPRWFEEWEQILSRFRPDSELQQLNRSEVEKVVVSGTLMEVLAAALRSAEETDGLVHPMMLGAMEAAGYDRTFDTLPREDDTPAYSARIPDWRCIRLNRSLNTVQLPAGGRIDLGGTAKGWAADHAAARLSAAGPALVEAGGDVAVSGLRADGSPWPVSVENPFDAEHPLCLLAVCGGGLATSGRDYRVWRRGGEMQHHILDPRTGRPAQTDVLTATVAAPSARRAEAAAKMALLLGADEGLRWVERHDEFAALIVLEDGTYRKSTHMKEMLWEGMLA